MAKIVTVYESDYTKLAIECKSPLVSDMSYIRWIKTSEALARRGHHVDMATNEIIWRKHRAPIIMGERLRRVPLSKVVWDDYNVIKTSYHRGFATLSAYGGTRHPFIISHLGSVVGPRDMEGIYFHGPVRRSLYKIQKEIKRYSKYISLLNNNARKLWKGFSPCSGKNVLIVPGAADRAIPAPARNPYLKTKGKICIFASNFFDNVMQPVAHKIIVDKLNQLGKFLLRYDVRLYVLGVGDPRRLNKKFVTYLGAVSYEDSWDYLYFAHVGIAISVGKFMHNNESTKIYYYLRTGLPVVIGGIFPNNYLVKEAGLGFIVESGNLELMAKKISEAIFKDWDRAYAVRYILENHTWDKRVEAYDKVITENFALSSGGRP